MLAGFLDGCLASRQMVPVAPISSKADCVQIFGDHTSGLRAHVFLPASGTEGSRFPAGGHHEVQLEARSARKAVGRSVVRSFGRAIGQSIGRSIGLSGVRSFGRSFVRWVGRRAGGRVGGRVGLLAGREVGWRRGEKCRSRIRLGARSPDASRFPSCLECYNVWGRGRL